MSLSRYWYSGFGNFNFVSGVAEKIEIISESATFSRGSNWNYSALSAFSICAHLKWFRRSRINWKKKGCLCDHQSFTLLNFIRSLRNKLKTAHTRRIKLKTEHTSREKWKWSAWFLPRVLLNDNYRNNSQIWN